MLQTKWLNAMRFHLLLKESTNLLWQWIFSVQAKNLFSVVVSWFYASIIHFFPPFSFSSFFSSNFRIFFWIFCHLLHCVSPFLLGCDSSSAWISSHEPTCKFFLTFSPSSLTFIWHVGLYFYVSNNISLFVLSSDQFYY